MSQYIEFYVKSKSGEFLPIGTFCRSSKIYEFGNRFVPYGNADPINSDTMALIFEEVRAEIENTENYIKRLEDEKVAILNMVGGSVEAKLEAYEDRQNVIDEVKDGLREIYAAKGFYETIATIIGEADNTRYATDEARWIDPNDYVYAGVECGNPQFYNNEEDESW